MNEGINKLFQRDNSTPTIEKFEVDLNELKEFLNIYDDSDDILIKSLVNAGKQYDIFTQKAAGTESSVKFIYRTPIIPEE